MRIRVALVPVIVAAVFLSGAPASEAQDQVHQRPGPRTPGIQGGVPRPDPTGQPRRPVRDPRQAPPEGTVTVRGRVVDGMTGQAIARAKVRVANRDPRTARTATTDAEGLFTLTRVPPGPLTLAAEKATYLSSSYPERQRTMRPTTLAVSDGQTLDNVTIPMYRGGAISGRIVDAYGDPVEHATVHAFFAPQITKAGPYARGGARGSQSTNDIGEYRIGRLEPGQYYVMVTPTPRRPSNQDDDATAPGRTWYPGVASFDQAQPITLERGSSIAGVEFQMLDTTLTRVSGVVLTSKGVPARGGHVSSRTTGSGKGMPQGLRAGWGESGGGQVDQNGGFEMMLPPGEYLLEANVQSGEELQKQGRFEMDRGLVRLSVGGESMSGVTIATGSGGTASGRFVFKGASAPPASLANFNVNFSGAMVGIDDCRSFTQAKVNPDGTFLAENIWGSCQFRAGGMARGWIFEAVMHNGNNITNRVTEFGLGRSLRDVEIVFTDRIGEIVVTVTDDRGQATEDFVTIAFPAEKEKWGDPRFLHTQAKSAQGSAVSPGVPMSRVAGGVRDDSMSGIGAMGGNTLRNLVAGDYFVVALEDSAFEDLIDPEHLERLSQMATRVTLSAGESQPVQLRRFKAPD